MEASFIPNNKKQQKITENEQKISENEQKKTENEQKIAELFHGDYPRNDFLIFEKAHLGNSEARFGFCVKNGAERTNFQPISM